MFAASAATGAHRVTGKIGDRRKMTLVRVVRLVPSAPTNLVTRTTTTVPAFALEIADLLNLHEVVKVPCTVTVRGLLVHTRVVPLPKEAIPV
jgi:hypothetical protein